MSSKSESGNDSKFGFKDKEKALETIELLKSHDLQYQKLTVRGLLGRAKRVLSMTKAEDKVKNIEQAIEVFEKWLEENGGGSGNKNAKTDSNEKIETVPGLGFKDKEAAEKTLRILKGRDPEYQKLAVKGLIQSSRRVLGGTKNEEKIRCIEEGVKILEDFLENFERKNVIRFNKAYLSYSVMCQFEKSKDEMAREFAEAYGGEKAKGNYKHLRTMYPKESSSEEEDSKSWDIIRNEHLDEIDKKWKTEKPDLFSADGEPTEIHLNMIHWAYSPNPDKLKNYLSKKSSKSEKRKMSTDEDESPTKKQKS